MKKNNDSFKKAKILIVDDEEGIRKQLSWALAPDFEVLQAQDKHSALGLIKEQGPDLVALDVSLTPGSTDGKEGMELLG